MLKKSKLKIFLVFANLLLLDIHSIALSQNLASEPKVYLCMGEITPYVQGFISQNNIGIAKLVGVAVIDPNDNLTIHQDLLESQIVKLFPNQSDKGVGVLDWEGRGLKILENGPDNNPDFYVALEKFKTVIEISKKLRPNVKWGFYALPFRNYWSMDKKWEKSCLALEPLLKTCDFIAPSLYSLYPDSSAKSTNEQFVHGNINIALRIASKINKPVYPFIWHRFPGGKMVDKAEFIRQAQRILNENFKDTKVKSIIWYGEELYAFNVKDKKTLPAISDKRAFGAFLSQLIESYGDALLKLLK